MTLPDGWRKVLLIIHVAASVGTLGADLALLTLTAAGLRGTDPALVYPAAYMVASFVLAPLALLALVTGVTLALLTGRGLFTYWWVTIKLMIATGLSGALLLSLIPALQRMADAATAPDALAIGRRIVPAVAPAAATALLAVALVLAILKPNWRLGKARKSL